MLGHIPFLGVLVAMLMLPVLLPALCDRWDRHLTTPLAIIVVVVQVLAYPLSFIIGEVVGGAAMDLLHMGVGPGLALGTLAELFAAYGLVAATVALAAKRQHRARFARAVSPGDDE